MKYVKIKYLGLFKVYEVNASFDEFTKIALVKEITPRVKKKKKSFSKTFMEQTFHS